VLPFDEAGDGRAVVLLHAGIADRTMWSEHLEPLAAAGYSAFAVDLPGFGEAAIDEGEQAPWLDVLETMDELAIDDAVLVGNSFGGAVALRAALLAPDRVSGLVPVSAPAPGVDPSPELEAAWEAEEAALGRGDREAAVQAVLDTWTLPGAPPELCERIAVMQRRDFELQAQAPPVAQAPDPLEEDPGALADLRMPALVAAGEYDMSDFRAGAEALAAAIPGARLEIIPGVGHLAPLEAPERFRALLLEFLDAGA
jgi:3-oxoadipate enol-lactonase